MIILMMMLLDLKGLCHKRFLSHPLLSRHQQISAVYLFWNLCLLISMARLSISNPIGTRICMVSTFSAIFTQTAINIAAFAWVSLNLDHGQLNFIWRLGCELALVWTRRSIEDIGRPPLKLLLLQRHMLLHRHPQEADCTLICLRRNAK